MLHDYGLWRKTFVIFCCKGCSVYAPARALSNPSSGGTGLLQRFHQSDITTLSFSFLHCQHCTRFFNALCEPNAIFIALVIVFKVVSKWEDIHVPSASRTHKFCRFYFSKTWFFLQLWKKTRFFSENMGFFSLLGKTLTLSHTWCHDISWFVPLDDSNPFIDTSLGSVPLSTLHVDYASTLLALAGSSHKKGPDALGKCRTTLSVITVNLESLDDVFARTTPRSINWHMAGFFSFGKNDSGLPKSNKQSNKSIEQN